MFLQYIRRRRRNVFHIGVSGNVSIKILRRDTSRDDCRNPQCSDASRDNNRNSYRRNTKRDDGRNLLRRDASRGDRRNNQPHNNQCTFVEEFCT